MAVLLETSRGDLALDLFVDDCPLACKNFLKLCKIKYYNNCIFHKVEKDFIVQTGDPAGTGTGGSSVYGVMYGEQARFFEDEIMPHLKHKKRGMLCMAGAGENMNASQFYITTGTNLDSLDEKHTIFGEVAEGMDVLQSINEAFVDKNGRPLQARCFFNIRIRHTLILDDPYDDPPQLEDHIPEMSPEPEFGTESDRLEDDWVPMEDQRSAEEIDKSMRAEEAKSRAVVLEMIGDLPDADVKPPSNMLFVCKLNPVTTDEDLEIIFSRFGTITSCDIIRDQKTGESLNYAFIGYDNDESSEQAYFKMNNVLIDDRRIKVDFSQSVHHIWKQFKKHGKAGGDKLMGQEADAHERQNPREFGSGNRKYELKPGRHQMSHGPRGGSRGGYTMVMDACEVMDAPTNGRGDEGQHSRQHAADRRLVEREDHRRREKERKEPKEKKAHRDKKDKRDREDRGHRDDGGRRDRQHPHHRGHQRDEHRSQRDNSSPRREHARESQGLSSRHRSRSPPRRHQR